MPNNQKHLLNLMKKQAKKITKKYVMSDKEIKKEATAVEKQIKKSVTELCREYGITIKKMGFDKEIIQKDNKIIKVKYILSVDL